MKILHIGLSEYETLEELQTAFNNLGKEVNKNGCQLMSSKKKAEENLKYQYEKFNVLGSRIFWYERGLFEGKETFILNETVFD
jgi:hypothetical protein